MSSCKSHKTCVSSAVAKAEAICRDKGLRFTSLRRKVLKLVWASHAPAKAYGILGKLRGKESAQPPIVYRALEFLQEHGLVHKLASCNAYVGCSHPLRHEECYFLICSRCSGIEECCSGEITRAIGSTAGKNRFTPRHITLEVEGECQACRRKAAS